MCRLRIRGKLFNYSIINAHASMEDKADGEKDAFYDELRNLYGACPKLHVLGARVYWTTILSIPVTRCCIII